MKEVLDDLESLERSLPDPSNQASIDKVLPASHRLCASGPRSPRFHRARPRLHCMSRARFPVAFVVSDVALDLSCDPWRQISRETRG